MDTGGIEKYKPINNSYYKKADCFLLVYDITERQSFNDCTNFFLSKIEENCNGKTFKILLLGNKMDLKDKRQISPEKGSLFALENNAIFMESSCETNDNVFKAFQTLIEITHLKDCEKLKEKIDNNEESKSKIKKEKKTLEEKINVFPKLMKFLNN